jgi:hypothetical protein
MYSANGTFQKAIGVATSAQSPAVARGLGADSGFSIAYQSTGHDIDLKTYSSSGALLHSYVIVSDGNTAAHPAVARNSAGDTVVAWQEYTLLSPPNLPGSRAWSVLAREVSAGGVVGSTHVLDQGARQHLLGQTYHADYTFPVLATAFSGNFFGVTYQTDVYTMDLIGNRTYSYPPLKEYTFGWALKSNSGGGWAGGSLSFDTSGVPFESIVGTQQDYLTEIYYGIVMVGGNVDYPWP